MKYDRRREAKSVEKWRGSPHIFLLMAGAHCIQRNDYADLNMITSMAGGLIY